MFGSGIAQTETLAIRPLSIGMDRADAVELIPLGGMWTISNMFAARNGLRRREGFGAYASLSGIAYNVFDLIGVWDTNGAQSLFAVTDGALYRINPGATPIEVPWQLDYTACLYASNGSYSVVLSGGGTAFDDEESYIMRGSILRVGSEEVRIQAIAGSNGLILESPVGASYVGSNGTVIRALPYYDTYPVDWTIYMGSLIFTYFNKGLGGVSPTPLIEYTLSGGSNGMFQPWLSNASYRIYTNGQFAAGCVANFLDRIWVGHIYEGEDLEQRARILWSSTANPRDFSEYNFLDLPTSGELQRLIPLNDKLIAYTDTSIFVGYETSWPYLPVAFKPLDTGGVGLVGPKAIAKYVHAHYFAGLNNFYKLTSDGQLTTIGDNIARSALEACSNKSKIRATVDLVNNTIEFGLPSNTATPEQITVIWVYKVDTGAWSYYPVSTRLLANPAISVDLTIEALGDTAIADIGTVFAGDVDAPISALTYGSQLPVVYIEDSVNILRQDLDYDTDNGGPIISTLISPVYDLGHPEISKTFKALRAKIDIGQDEELTSSLIYSAYGSVNRGRNWKYLGQLTIPTSSDEGYVNFFMTGPGFQFKLIGGSGTNQYTITQLELSYRAIGNELTGEFQKRI